MRSILILQLVLPVALVVWFAAWPARSTLGFITQQLAFLSVLAALTMVGIWSFPPWWTPYVAALALLLLIPTSRLRARRHGATSRWPAGLRGWSAMGVFAMLVVASVVVLTESARGHALPVGIESVELTFPLRGDRLLVANGGSTGVLNAHMRSLDTTLVLLRPWRGNAYAVDIVALNWAGLRAPGLQPSDPSSYRIFGLPVHAPCDGTVLLAVDGLPDMPVPVHDREHLAGNHILLRCRAMTVDVLLAHLREGSLRARVGDTLVVGQLIGEVGNSGGTDEPHLHVHAQRPGPAAAPLGGDPVPALFGGRFLVRGDRLRSPD